MAAEVRLDGSPWQSISGVKTTRNIASAEMVSGRAVLVETGDYSDPGDSVLCAVWS